MKASNETTSFWRKCGSKLYDTYGFPYELTLEPLQATMVSQSMKEGFQAEMQAQKTVRVLLVIETSMNITICGIT